MMAKTLVFEQTVSVDAEQIVMKLFTMSRGYSLERRVIEKDDAISVQILLIHNLAELNRFADADPYISQMAPFYNKVCRRLANDGPAE